MDTSSIHECWEEILQEYPDLLTLDQLCDILHVGRKSGRQLLSSGEIPYMKIGKYFRIPKIYIIDFLQNAVKTE